MMETVVGAARPPPAPGGHAAEMASRLSGCDREASGMPHLLLSASHRQHELARHYLHGLGHHPFRSRCAAGSMVVPEAMISPKAMFSPKVMFCLDQALVAQHSGS